MCHRVTLADGCHCYLGFLSLSAFTLTLAPSPQMKFSLEKLQQGISISEPPFDTPPRPDDGLS